MEQEFLYFCYEIYLIAEFIYRITLMHHADFKQNKIVFMKKIN